MAIVLPELPDEVWNHIFQFLPPVVQHKTVSLVCKHWLKLIRNGLRHLKVTRNLYMKYFGLPWNFIYGIKISDDRLNIMMQEYLNIWPYVQSIDFYYIGETKPEDLLTKSLDYFKRLWDLPFLKSLYLSVYCHKYRSMSFSGIFFKPNSIKIQYTRMYCEDSGLHELFSHVKLFTNLLKGTEIEYLSIGRAHNMGLMSENPEYVRTMEQFLTSNINNIQELCLHDINAKSKLLTVLEPLMKTDNYKLKKVFLTFQGRGISKDFLLLQNLNQLTKLKIRQAAFRFEDFNLIGQTCHSLEVFHFEGASDSDIGFTYITLSRLAQFLSGWKALKTIKDIRITNINAVNKCQSFEDLEEYSHNCLHPDDCVPVQEDFKRDAELHLVDIMKNFYSKDCFILILFYNVHFLPIINIDIDWEHPNLKNLLLAKNREDDIRVEYLPYDLMYDFPEYFDIVNTCYYVLKPKK